MAVQAGASWSKGEHLKLTLKLRREGKGKGEEERGKGEGEGRVKRGRLFKIGNLREGREDEG